MDLIDKAGAAVFDVVVYVVTEDNCSLFSPGFSFRGVLMSFAFVGLFPMFCISLDSVL